MPRVRQLTEALRSEEKRKSRTERNKRIIMNAARAKTGSSLKNICADLGIAYGTVYSRLRTGNIRLTDVVDIAEQLDLDDDTLLALMGRPKKCRYEWQ